MNGTIAIVVLRFSFSSSFSRSNFFLLSCYAFAIQNEQAADVPGRLAMTPTVPAVDLLLLFVEMDYFGSVKVMVRMYIFRFRVSFNVKVRFWSTLVNL